MARGIDGGIKVLSNINMMLAALLLAFIAFVIGNVGILDPVMQTAGNYLANIVPLSNWTGREDEQWLRDWTVFYWAWWVSWSPFVGLFIRAGIARADCPGISDRSAALYPLLLLFSG